MYMSPKDKQWQRATSARKALNAMQADRPSVEEIELALEQELDRRKLQGLARARQKMQLKQQGYGEQYDKPATSLY
jgi:hypothetical protein